MCIFYSHLIFYCLYVVDVVVVVVVSVNWKLVAYLAIKLFLILI